MNMPDLEENKVGLISCSGEELPEGTISRIAVRLVLERLRNDKTVTICLPLFLAGGEDDREFARDFPTITVDGCGKLCALKGTEKFSGKVSAHLDVQKVLAEKGMKLPEKANVRDSKALMPLAEAVAEELARMIDELIAREQ